MPDPSNTEAFTSKDVEAGRVPTLNETSAFEPTHSGTPIPSASPADALIGTSIDRYTLVKKLGEGGMGAVYLADQSEPVKRQVALKLIRGHVDSRSILARFEAERQALAVMDHPHIARIYDGGTSASQQPYFVMELVQGVPITQYCDQHRLSLKKRLELFVPICQAVQHAHQKGIIHRDLKPGNVLVTEVDGKPIPKVIDFGVAKATEQPLTDQSLGDTGAIVGTPTYMSPEQADPLSMDIDTRTDIYALGVMLYELLTGSTPIDAKEFKRGALLEVLRMVREVEPPRPSTKLSTAPALPSIAANRNVEPRELQAMLRGDIDWIVMKAIEKDRTRRYETANGFAADVQRYLTGEAVLAHPPSRWYQVLKLVKRNRLQVIAAGLVLLALIAGVIGTTVGLFQAQRAQLQAEKRLLQIEKGVNLFAEMLKGLNPRSEEQGAPPLYEQLRQKAEKAAEQLKGEAVGDSLSMARLQTTLGVTLLELGSIDKAVELLERSRPVWEKEIGGDHLDTLGMLNNLASAYREAGRFPEAIKLYQHIKATVERTLEADHPSTLITLNNLADAFQAAGRYQEAVKLHEQIRDIRMAKLQPDHPDILITLNNLAEVYRIMGRHQEAIQLHEKARDGRVKKLGPEHSDTLTSQSNLALAYDEAGRTKEAIRLYEQIRDVRIKKLGPNHPHTLTTLNNLAATYQATGRIAEAIRLYEKVHEGRVKILGADHHDTLVTLLGLAAAYRNANQLPKSIQCYEQVRDSFINTLGAKHPNTITAMSNLALAYQTAGRLTEAIALFEQVRGVFEKELGDDHPKTLGMLNNLAATYQDSKRLPEAILLYKQVRDAQVRTLGADHPSTLTTFANLASAYLVAGNSAEGISHYEQSASGIANRKFQHPFADAIIHETIQAYEGRKQFERSEAWRRKWIAFILTTVGKEHPSYSSELSALGLTLIHQKKWPDAVSVLRESLDIREKIQPNDWRTFNSQSMLGGALLGQKKYTDAEPLLIQGYEGMKQREKTIPPQANTRLPEALDRLIQLYTETNKLDDVKKWQAERKRFSDTPKKK